MLAHVKMPHTEIDVKGKDCLKVVELLRKSFKNVEVELEETMPILETEWYNDLKKDWSIAKEIRTNRKKFQFSQEELGNKIGKSKHYISDLENERRTVSISLAKDLGKIFKKDYRKFL